MYDATNIQNTQAAPQAPFTTTATPMVTDEQLDSRAVPNRIFNPGGQDLWRFALVG